MCEFCTKHGEGKKWYLNVKNYSSDLLSDLRRREIVEDFFYWVDRSYNRYFNFLKHLPFNAPIAGPAIRTVLKRLLIYRHWGQAIPVEDVEKVLSFTNSIVRIPCVCRKVTTGKEMRMCFLMSLNPKDIGMAEIVDRSFFGGPDIANFEKVEKDSVMDFMRGLEKKGYFHSIWSHGTPYACGLCNCDNTGCIPLKMYKEVTPNFFKAEYIAMVDKDRCNGCNACVKICPFEAIKSDIANKKIMIDYEKCFGCGICRSVCKKKAIFLQDRNLQAKTAHLW